MRLEAVAVSSRALRRRDVRYLKALRDAYRLILLDPHGWLDAFALLGRPWPLPHRASRLPRRLGLMEEALGLVRTGVVPHAPQREAEDIVGPFPERWRVTEAAARHRPARAGKVAQRDRLSGPIDRLRRSPGVPGGIGREPREFSEPGVSHHPRRARLDGLGRSIPLQEALRSPIERPSS